MNTLVRIVFVAVLAGIILLGTASAQVLLTSGLQGASGSTIGPDGALYVTEGSVGRVSRVHPGTGEVTTYWGGLPPQVIPLGGVMDVAFLDGIAYAIVTLVGPDVGGSDTVGLYRMDGPSSSTLIADIGAFALANPPDTDYFVPTGLQFAMETFRGGFLITDGHHNRVLWVSRHGDISVVNAFANVVPTGLEVRGKRVYVAELGPAPNDPEDGRVISFEPEDLTPRLVGSGARMVVDVEFGLGNTMYALGQGIWDGVMPGSPAFPNTGNLVEVNGDGTFTEVATGLDRPTSMEFIGNSAYIVSLAGDIWVLDDVSDPPFGR